MQNINQVSPKIIMNSNYHSLSKVEKKIAQYCLDNFNEIEHANITDIATALNVSESSILRFTKRLGYNGYKEFKIYCSIFDSSTSSNNHFEEFNNEISDISKILEANIRSNIHNLKVTLDYVDFNVLENVARSFVQYEKIFIIGNGYSSIIAKYLYHLLFTMNKDVNLSTNAFDKQQSSYKINEKSFVFFISQKGRNNDDIDLANFSNKKGALTSCLTRVASTPLSEVVSEPIIVNSLTDKEASNYLLTQISFSVIINTIYMYMSIQLQNKDPEYSSEFLDGFDHLHSIFGF